MIANAQLWFPGNAAYNRAVSTYGVEVANQLSAAAQKGDERAMLEIIARLGRPGVSPGTKERDDSALNEFVRLITTNPLEAPLASANNQIGKAVWNIVKNPFVLLTLAIVGFYFVGGFAWLKRWVASK